MESKMTLVTGLWDIARGVLKEPFGRDYSNYLECFEKLLAVPCDMIIYGDEELRKFVFKRRTEADTQFILRDKTWYTNNAYAPLIDKIRNDYKWYNQKDWLSKSPQAVLEYYNPILMSKMFMLNDATILSKFKKRNLYWIDAGLANTVNIQDYFIERNAYKKIDTNKMIFVSYPYDADTEVHGFDYEAMKKITGKNTNYVCRGGFFGGNPEMINKMNGLYYHLLIDTLSKGLMGADETLFTILSEIYPHDIDRYEIGADGLMGTFFENAVAKPDYFKKERLSLYVLSFNAPDQFEKLIYMANKYDPSILRDNRLILLNNSTDENLFERYNDLCNLHHFEQLRNGNMGISRSRQFAAEHFNESNSDFMVYFEDDMFFSTKNPNSQFATTVGNLMNKCIDIINREDLDYLKLTFDEFYGDNSKQWGWINLPDDKMAELYPNYTAYKHIGNIPPTKYEKIDKEQDLYYAVGQPHYCNWPIMFSKTGNKKVFLDTYWTFPDERTWMSHIHQEQLKGNIKAGVLLLNPIEHNRFCFYKDEDRREN